MAEVKGSCWSCGNSLSASDYGRADSCSKCGNDTKVCKNCEFYDPSYNNECKENQADRVVEKERSNFCDYFQASFKTGEGQGKSRSDLKSAAEALFKKKN